MKGEGTGTRTGIGSRTGEKDGEEGEGEEELGALQVTVGVGWWTRGRG